MSPDFEVKKEIPGRFSLRRASCAAALLGETVFWIGMLMAARRYPSEYDWRYIAESNLVSPDNNPAGYLWGATGVVVCGLCWWWWAAVLSQLREQGGAAGRPWGIQALKFGIIFMILTTVVPRRLLPVQKGHEILASLMFAGLCVGMLGLMFRVVERALMKKMHRSVGHARRYAALAAGAAVFPILLAGLTQAYVRYALPELPWVNLSWRARGVPAYLSFAFWEWTTCAVLSVYVGILSLAAPAVYSASTPQTGEEGDS